MKRTFLLLIPVLFLTLIYSQSVEIKDSSDETLLIVNDEGTDMSSITIQSSTSAPTIPTDKLYNEVGTLKWNGSTLGTVGGLSINDLSDGKTDDYSIFLGKDAGKVDDGNNYNTFIGQFSGSANTDGSYNTLVGYRSGYKINNGDRNSLFGYYAGHNITYGSKNTIFGNQAGMCITNGSGNVIIGHYAGDMPCIDISDKLIIANSGLMLPLIYGDFSTKDVIINGDLEVSGTITGASDDGDWIISGDHIYSGVVGYVGIGTSTPTSKLQVVGIPAYATDTAAGEAGLTAGAFYQTSGHATLPNGVLMVKQ